MTREKLILLAVAAALSGGAVQAGEQLFLPVKIDGPVHDPPQHTYWFGPFSECCSVADFDGDGDLDIAAGRNWYEAPGLEETRRLPRRGADQRPRNRRQQRIRDGRQPRRPAGHRQFRLDVYARALLVRESRSRGAAFGRQVEGPADPLGQEHGGRDPRRPRRRRRRRHPGQPLGAGAGPGDDVAGARRPSAVAGRARDRNGRRASRQRPGRHQRRRPQRYRHAARLVRSTGRSAHRPVGLSRRLSGPPRGPAGAADRCLAPHAGPRRERRQTGGHHRRRVPRVRLGVAGAEGRRRRQTQLSRRTGSRPISASSTRWPWAT